MDNPITVEAAQDKALSESPQVEAKEENITVVEAPLPVKRGRGRPPGAKNKETLFKELMTGHFQSKAIEDIEKVYCVLFAKAHEGDMKAIKMVLDRVVPVQKAADGQISKGGITVSINVGSMETESGQEGEIIEDAEFEVIE